MTMPSGGNDIGLELTWSAQFERGFLPEHVLKHQPTSWGSARALVGIEDLGRHELGRGPAHHPHRRHSGKFGPWVGTWELSGPGGACGKNGKGINSNSRGEEGVGGYYYYLLVASASGIARGTKEAGNNFKALPMTMVIVGQYYLKRKFCSIQLFVEDKKACG